ncbi:class I SAM-dependent methyltransferase [Chitinophaga vietnamensis]|uniref:class I SAM-dependent methyltransferase n=1 Tax=Chitinophaga vietnamensis TaxID=2593957 RepID=UPI00117786B6|nr:class I SAM-dependent methyltransferase [Chitinophaga vietnamensis]
MNDLQKLKVPPTSTLVLQYAQKFYTGKKEKQYLQLIDYSGVAELAAKIDALYSSFDELICLRKFCIREMIRERFLENGIQQVLILGGGLDPVTIFLMEQYGNRISHVFEVDNGFIEEKEQLFRQLFDYGRRMHFIKCDITDSDLLMAKLAVAGYQPGIPTIVIFEGVIHYITNTEFVSLFRYFMTDDHRNIVLMDYSLVLEEATAAFYQLHKNFLDMVADSLRIPFNVNYRDTILDLVSQLDGQDARIHTYHELEKRLYGETRLFKARGEGILEVMSFHI